MAASSTQSPETQDGDGNPRRTASDSDNTTTPRTEAPAIIRTNPTPLSNVVQDEGYFALKPTESHTSAATSTVQASPAPSIASSSSSSLKLRDAVLDVTRRFSQQLEGSAKSRDATPELGSPQLSGRPLRPVIQTSGPTYPNQAFSALHQQHYPPPHIPPTLRAKTTHSSHVTVTSDVNSTFRPIGSRTAGHTPTITPGLFNPSPVREHVETPTSEGSPYPSPYLHYLHTQTPKETHVADIDVDPISGRKIINGYEIIDELGRGTHGKVKLGRSLTTGHFVAIKIVERYSKKRRLGRLGNAEDKVKREVAILKKARHPNIVALLEVIDDPSRKKVYIVLERVDLGEIAWRVDSPREIAMVEYRRYERESQGYLNDPAGEEEDQALLDLARMRRAKVARARWKKLKRMRDTHGHAHTWSIELAGDSDEESETDTASRAPTSYEEANAEILEIERALSRASLGSLQGDVAEHPHPTSSLANEFTFDNSDPFSDETPTHAPEDPLEGTMYGSYNEIENPLPTAGLETEDDLDSLSRNLSHGNLLEKATEILDADVHPDLLYVPCMSIQSARAAFRDTLLGLQYLHYQGIIHRDIKPPNLLQTRDRRTKISDFGVSYLGRPVDEDQSEDVTESDAQDFDEAKELAKTVGTAAFYAPELCYTDTSDDHPPVGKPIDVWALGITLFCMLFARVPFVDQEYQVMRRIAEEEIYIPQRRLKPSDPRPKSRPPSHGRYFPSVPGTRHPFDLEYENLDDTLIDLLKRLLTKDPKKRITLEEVRHHAWVVADIQDKSNWIDETDPTRQAHGEKIEVSKEDIEKSVVPISIMERIRSGIKKAVGSVGLGRSGSTKRSNHVLRESQTPPSSSSSTASLEARRTSLRGDETIFSALKASRESDHPLTQSVTASPELSVEHNPFFAATTSLATPRAGVEPLSPTLDRGHIERPDRPDRVASTLSTTGSTRTVRPSDVGGKSWRDSSPEPMPALPVPSEGSTGTSSIVAGATRLLKTVRDRSTAGRSEGSRARSSSRASSEAADAHADATLAVSTASAAGHVNPPEVLSAITPGSKQTSPEASSFTSKAASPVRGKAFSPASIRDAPTSLDATVAPNALSLTAAAMDQVSSRPQSRIESSDERFQRAENENFRRHIAEVVERSSSSASQHTPVSDACPPSPDDELSRPFRRRLPTQSNDSVAPSMTHSLETSPASPNSSLAPLMTPSSSDDRFAIGPSTAMSNPSIPSVLSRNGSDALYESYPSSKERTPDLLSSDDTIEAAPHPAVIPSALATADDEDDEGYTPDSEALAPEQALAIDDDDDDSSDEEELMMGSRRPNLASHRSLSITNATLARYRERRETGGSVASKKSSRSGSNNTMRKVRTRSLGEGERGSGGTSARGQEQVFEE